MSATHQAIAELVAEANRRASVVDDYDEDRGESGASCPRATATAEFLSLTSETDD